MNVYEVECFILVGIIKHHIHLLIIIKYDIIKVDCYMK